MYSPMPLGSLLLLLLLQLAEATETSLRSSTSAGADGDTLLTRKRLDAQDALISKLTQQTCTLNAFPLELPQWPTCRTPGDRP